MGVKKELKTFALTTSVKGVPRVMKSGNKCIMSVWLVCTVLFLAIATYQCWVLLSDYLSHPYTTKTYEQFLDLSASSSEEASIQLPDVTVCNLNPFAGNASELIADLGLISMSEFKKLIKSQTCSNCSSPTDEYILQSALREVLTSQGYYAHVGPENASAVSHAYEDFIIDCGVHHMHGLRTYVDGCTPDKVTTSLYLDSTKYNCYTFHMANQTGMDGFTMLGLSLVMHLDNFFEEHYNTFDTANDYSHDTGILYVLHEAGTVPLLHREALKVLPGSKSHAKVVISQRFRLKSPWGSCTEQEKVADELFAYSFEGCFSECMENRIASRCGCIDTTHLAVLAQQYEGLPFCFTVDEGADVLLSQVMCAESDLAEWQDECFSACPLPCEQTFYKSELSAANWPYDPFTELFYETYIANHSFEWRYASLHDWIYNNITDRTSYWEIRQHVADNFLALELVVTDIVYLQYTDVASMSLASFISSLGGTLNLWAGITIILLIELVELIINVIFQPSQQQS